MKHNHWEMEHARQGLGVVKRSILHNQQSGSSTAILLRTREELEVVLNRKLVVYGDRDRRGRFDPCCNKEDRDMDGWCMSCGDPCL